MKAPFPWFGGKSRVAHIVWQRFGDVSNYVEPFAGSLACLLGRPQSHYRVDIGAWPTETVNDIDGHLCNVWRAMACDPDEVARYADYPVSELDLHARHDELIRMRGVITEELRADPDWYDARAAGWWIWGISQWIGSGWCPGNGGNGSHQLPHLGDGGKGSHRLGRSLLPWFAELSSRLRRVRVCCGDWSRVVTNGALSHGTTVGVFLDPPYDMTMRDAECYVCDEAGISSAVRSWAIEHGSDTRLRIAMCGYGGEHDMPGDWDCVAWKTIGGYGNSGSNNANRTRERIWFSPACLKSRQLEIPL